MQSKALIILVLALVAFLAVKVSADEFTGMDTEWGTFKDCKNKGPDDCEKCCDARHNSDEGSYYSYGENLCICAYQVEYDPGFEEAPYDPFRIC